MTKKIKMTKEEYNEKMQGLRLSASAFGSLVQVLNNKTIIVTSSEIEIIPEEVVPKKKALPIEALCQTKCGKRYSTGKLNEFWHKHTNPNTQVEKFIDANFKVIKWPGEVAIAWQMVAEHVSRLDYAASRTPLEEFFDVFLEHYRKDIANAYGVKNI